MMSTSAIPNKTVYLTDYKAYPFVVDAVRLHFELFETHTRLRSELSLRPLENACPLILFGENLELEAIELNGSPLTQDAYSSNKHELVILQPPAVPFVIGITTKLYPDHNKALSGLYRSNRIYCTQCEAEGFRRMTYYPDRPDVLSRFWVRIEADKKSCPVLLSNGEIQAQGDLGARHWVEWHDPHKKPSYLFALVAGDLMAVEDKFLRQDQGLVTLKLYVEHKYGDQCLYALEALKKAFAWDEKTFGRIYDLNIYMLVAIGDFNMGAMENKGLNIFNTKYLLARPELATDTDYLNIDRVVGHEYFHNWSGNRVTCRDWFQLSLKEGLTVFREQQFTNELLASEAALIDQVKLLQTRQFAEDASPLAHPVQPHSYEEINNFYTVTVYEKGAELIRMYQTLLGRDKFRAAMIDYFTRFDGLAATIDDFLACHARALGEDLSQFKHWYTQAGTPQVTLKTHYDPKKQSLHLHFEQSCPPTPGQACKPAFLIPLQTALLDDKGQFIPFKHSPDEPLRLEQLCILREKQTQFTIPNIAAEPIVVTHRQFSAPIKLVHPLALVKLEHILAFDNDPYSVWSAAQKLMLNSIRNFITDKSGEMSHLLAGLKQKCQADNPDLRLLNELLQVPTLESLIPDFAGAPLLKLQAARRQLIQALITELKEPLSALYHRYRQTERYTYEASQASSRSLSNTCLNLLVQDESQAHRDLAFRQFTSARNMTCQLGALQALNSVECPERLEAYAQFYALWQDEPLVLDKWFALQAKAPIAQVFETVKSLAQHPQFTLSNPNRVYALLQSFASQNTIAFHQPEGRPYQFLSDFILQIEAFNPQVASRLANNYSVCTQLEPACRSTAHGIIKTLAQKAQSNDVQEIIRKILGGFENN